MPPDIEVFIDIAAGLKRVGTLRRQPRRGGESVSFEYHPSWLGDPTRFSLEPALTLGRGVFAPGAGLATFGSLGDSAPDTWGRRLMQRAERRRAERESRAVRTLLETDYLLGVSDVSRLGALRFRRAGEDVFLSPAPAGVPGLIEMGRLLQATQRLAQDKETDEDLHLIFAPGSSLGGARPKVSVRDRDSLWIAKFPKETDEYSIETWEAVALRLAELSGIRTPPHQLLRIAEQPVLLSRRFDRDGQSRIPFLSALSMLGLKDGTRGSYPELVDALSEHGDSARADAHELYRRMTFNVLISNVDDHLRNHGFTWAGTGGWRLSPAYDLNPTPSDLRPRILTTNINLEEGTCDIGLVLSVSDYFGLSPAEARAIVKQVAGVTRTWREVARAASASAAEIRRMESAFEHDDLVKALGL